MVTVVPLRNYRWARRKARIEVGDGAVTFVLPTYFGKRPWTVPAQTVAVADLTTDLMPATTGEVLYADSVVIPYLFTTGPATTPTMALVFGEPQRVPPLRWVAALAPNSDLPFGWRQSRSQEGARLDGVLLRAADPVDALTRLTSAGVERVSDPDAWLQRSRRLITDPLEIAAAGAWERKGVRWNRAANAVLLGGVVGVPLLLGNDSWWALASIAVAMPTAYVIRRRLRKAMPPSGPR